jgi:hypothetical protein
MEKGKMIGFGRLAVEVLCLILLCIIILMFEDTKNEVHNKLKQWTVAAAADSAAKDSLEREDMHTYLNRLYRFGALEARHDTTGMCHEVMDNWLGLENDVDRGLRPFAPVDSVNSVERGTYVNAAKFLRDYCGPTAAKLKATDERFTSYLEARRIAYAIGK